MSDTSSLSPVASEIGHLKEQFIEKSAAVVLSEVEIASLVQVSFWSGADEKGLFGLLNEDIKVMHTAPQTFLLLSSKPDLIRELEEMVSEEQAVLTDLSHSRTMFRLSGEGTCALLSKGLSLDLDERSFAFHTVKQTTIAHMGVTCYRTAADTFELLVFRSLAGSLLTWLVEAGHREGLRVA